MKISKNLLKYQRHYYHYPYKYTLNIIETLQKRLIRKLLFVSPLHKAIITPKKNFNRFVFIKSGQRIHENAINRVSETIRRI